MSRSSALEENTGKKCFSFEIDPGARTLVCTDELLCICNNFIDFIDLVAVSRDGEDKTRIHSHFHTDDSEEWETQEEEEEEDEEEEGWTLDDVEFELVEPVMEKETLDQQEDRNEAGAASGTAKDKLAFFEPEARVLLNLIKLSESGSRWNTTSRKAMSLIEMPRTEEKAASRRRARYERCSSMLEKLQSCLNRAEAKSSAAALESVKQLEGKNNSVL